LSTKDVR